MENTGPTCCSHATSEESCRQESCIHHVPIFQSLDEQDVQLLSTVIHSNSYAKGEYVFREGESSNTLFVLHQGLIKITMVSELGKEHIVRFLFPGDFFGQSALLQEKNHYANAEVLEPAVVCQINREDFKQLIERNPSMAYRFLIAMSKLMQQADDWAGAVTLLEVEQRLAKLLIHFKQLGFVSEGSIVLPAAKKELAAMIGTTPETLSRKLSQLEAANIIAVNRRQVRILSSEKLHDIAGVSAV